MLRVIPSKELSYIAALVNDIYSGATDISRSIPLEGFPDVSGPINRATILLCGLDGIRNLQQQSLEKYAKQKETIEDVLDITTIEKGMNDLETGIVLFTSFREQQLIDERSVPRKHLVRGDQAAKYLSERPFFEEFNSTRELVLAYAQGALEHHKQLLVK